MLGRRGDSAKVGSSTAHIYGFSQTSINMTGAQEEYFSFVGFPTDKTLRM
jgi:hypothetical protein